MFDGKVCFGKVVDGGDNRKWLKIIENRSETETETEPNIKPVYNYHYEATTLHNQRQVSILHCQSSELL